ncbi:MAG: HAMP domain-containing histidine kinase [Actinomycetota bacterium]|nr:HAMP domain-containing histidine kinase [Actinomycetota bacterium]
MIDRRRTRLRFRLCLTFTSIVAFLIVGQAAYLSYTTTQESGDSQQRVLRREAERLAGRLRAGGPVDVTLAELRAEGLFQRDGTLRQFVAADGTVLESSDLLLGTDPLLSGESVRRVSSEGSTLRIGWEEGRRPAYGIAVPTSPPVVVIAMARTDWAALQRQRLLRFELVVIPFSICVGAALAWVTIGKQLRRLRSIVRAAEAVAAGDLGVPHPSGPKDELFAISAALTEITGSLRGALNYQQRFAAQAAHELRSPLAIMKAESDLALSSDSLEETRRALSSIGEETEKLAFLIQDLLAFGQSGLASLPIEEVTTTDLVASATMPLVGLASDHEVRLRVDVEPASVQVSRVGMEHAVRNLVENAIKAAPPGSAVRLSGRQENGSWHLAVDDAGPGVDAALTDRIFDPFVGSRAGGHGLGLTFVKLIAEAHQGKATMERLGNGTTRFSIVIPVNAPARSS